MPQDSADAGFVAFSTIATIHARGRAARRAVREASELVRHLDRLWSCRPDSEIQALNRARSRWTAVSPETDALLQSACTLRDLTAGAFDVTAGSPLGIGELERRPAGEFRLAPGRRVDVAGLAKGVVAGYVASLLTSHGVDGALISIGQSSAGLVGRPDHGGPWSMGVRASDGGPTATCGVIHVDGGFVCTSGEGAGAAHILDPRTGRPAASDLRAATVVSDDPALAEACSTALVVLGRSAALALQRRLGFEAVLIDAAGKATATPHVARVFRPDAAAFPGSGPSA